MGLGCKLSGGELRRNPKPKLRSPLAMSGQFSAKSLRVFMLEIAIDFTLNPKPSLQPFYQQHAPCTYSHPSRSETPKISLSIPQAAKSLYNETRKPKSCTLRPQSLM